jgi:hypothetical protein
VATQADPHDFGIQSKLNFGNKNEIQVDHQRCDILIDELKEQLKEQLKKSNEKEDKWLMMFKELYQISKFNNMTDIK